jgi:spermidine synthase
MIAKIILPWFGGSALVWTACMLFFQTALLAGYLYAHWMATSTRPTGYFHIALLAASLLLLPVIPSATWKPLGDANPLPRILGLLAATVGAPYTLLSTTGPLVQSWYSRRNSGAVPYRLFSLSNFASLLALLSYPVLIEPWIPATVQATAWSAEYAIFVALMGWLTLEVVNHPLPPIAPQAAAASRITAGQSFLWIVLPAFASFLLLATTNYLCQNVAVVPFLWILPLSIYLVSFILCFGGNNWYRRAILLPLFCAVMALAGYLVMKETPGTAVILHIVVYSLTLFFICMFCHGELALRKPEPAHLTRFYLMISFGGALGSLLAAVGAPLMLHGIFEFALGLAGCGMLALLLEYRKSWITDIVWAGLAIWLLVVARWQIGKFGEGTRFMERSFYGVVRVFDTQDEGTESRLRTVVHGVVSHGAQILDPARRREPTSYYARNSGVGIVLQKMDKPAREIGVVGLGAGTLAAYSRPGDEFRFYELDPLMIQVARSQFTFLADSPARIATVAGDGRLALERETGRHFDLLAIDAFSGDSVPVHLLSKEAFELYFDRLAPDGILAVHISNVFLDLAPVVGREAQALSKPARVVKAPGNDRTHASASEWVLLAHDAAVLDRFLDGTEWHPAPTPGNLRVWNDDYSNLFQILRR